MTTDLHEVRGVRLGDLYRDHDGNLWEVYGLVTEPQACLRRVDTDDRADYVIGCLNWKHAWKAGPLREY